MAADTNFGLPETDRGRKDPVVQACPARRRSGPHPPDGRRRSADTSTSPAAPGTSGGRIRWPAGHQVAERFPARGRRRTDRLDRVPSGVGVNDVSRLQPAEADNLGAAVAGPVALPWARPLQAVRQEVHRRPVPCHPAARRSQRRTLRPTHRAPVDTATKTPTKQPRSTTWPSGSWPTGGPSGRARPRASAVEAITDAVLTLTSRHQATTGPREVRAWLREVALLGTKPDDLPSSVRHPSDKAAHRMAQTGVAVATRSGHRGRRGRSPLYAIQRDGSPGRRQHHQPKTGPVPRDAEVRRQEPTPGLRPPRLQRLETTPHEQDGRPDDRALNGRSRNPVRCPRHLLHVRTTTTRVSSRPSSTPVCASPRHAVCGARTSPSPTKDGARSPFAARTPAQVRASPTTDKSTRNAT